MKNGGRKRVWKIGGRIIRISWLNEHVSDGEREIKDS